MRLSHNIYSKINDLDVINICKTYHNNLAYVQTEGDVI